MPVILLFALVLISCMRCFVLMFIALPADSIDLSVAPLTSYFACQAHSSAADRSQVDNDPRTQSVLG